jgi:hypothetical protein
MCESFILSVITQSCLIHTLLQDGHFHARFALESVPHFMRMLYWTMLVVAKMGKDGKITLQYGI